MMKIDPTKHMPNGARVHIERYQPGGGFALIITEGDRHAQDTRPIVYLATMFIRGVRDANVLLKTWDLGEGIPEALVNAGLVEFTDRTTKVGTSSRTVQHAKLTPAAIRHYMGED